MRNPEAFKTQGVWLVASIAGGIALGCAGLLDFDEVSFEDADGGVHADAGGGGTGGTAFGTGGAQTGGTGGVNSGGTGGAAGIGGVSGQGGASGTAGTGGAGALEGEPWQGGHLTAAWAEPDNDRYLAISVGLQWDVEMCGAPASWSTAQGGDMESRPGWSSAPVVSGQRPWEGTGVTAAWRIGDKRYIISVDKYWVYDGQWLASGNLSDVWQDAPLVDGAGPHELAGVTAGWASGSSVTVISKDRYWTFAASGSDLTGWEPKNSGHVDELAHWTDAPAVDGRRPWDGPGVTAGWYDERRRLLGVASQDRYWLLDLAAEESSRWRWVSSGYLTRANPFTRVEGLTIITYNIASAMNGVYGEPSAMLEKLAGFVAQHRADLVGLQEVDVGTDRHSGADMPSILLSKLDGVGYPMHGQFANRFNWDGGQFGIMALSTRAMEGYSVRQVVNNVVTQTFETNLCAGRVRLFNYHPFPGDDACAATDPHFMNIVGEAQNEMTVLTGDFNAWPGLSCYATVTQSHADACEVAGEASCSNTVDISWHPGHPELRIDHAFYRGDTTGGFGAPWRAIWAFSDHQINDGLAVSDHYPVIARLVYEAPEN
jgi:endonuclease/exonuclease/phosphatase family metal-dependent hydrolase